jgi:hypothetical protein
MRISKIGFVILGAAAIGNSVAAQTPPVQSPISGYLGHADEVIE